MGFVAVMMTSCGNHTAITTPMRDVQTIAHLAQTVTTEAELRAVEKLAADMELAYRHSYNGAKGREFKRLVEPVLIEAGKRREECRAAEDHLAEQQATLHNHLADLDAAWSMKLQDKDSDWSTVIEKRGAIDSSIAKVAELEARKEQLAMDIIDAGYPAEMLDEMGNIEDEIAEVYTTIASTEHDIEILVLAYRLQQGCDLEAEMCPAVEELLPDSEADVVE